MRRPILLALFAFLAAILPLRAQLSPSEQVQVGPPPVRRAEAPSPGATAEELEKRGDELKADKSFLDAIDYYRAALGKKAKDAALLNRIGICELLMHRLPEARKDLERAIKANKNFADAYNNLGVVLYLEGANRHDNGRFGKAIKQYDKAIKLQPDAASYYNNIGAAYFARKEFEKASVAYSQALQLDPDIFERTSRSGVTAQLASPEDRAHYDYVLAKLYAKAGNLDRSLVYLGRAMEEGYKGINDVYKDQEFAGLRKDPRFTQLMTDRPPAIPE